MLKLLDILNLMITIRQYKKTDFQQVIALIKGVELYDSVWDTEENFSGMSDKDPSLMLVVEVNSKIVGNLFMIPYGTKVTFLFRLAVKQEYQRQGIGTQLLKHAQTYMQKRGCMEVGLLVDSGDMGLQQYYEKKGFKRSKKAYYYMFKDVTNTSV